MHRLLRLPWERTRYARRKTQAERPYAEIKGAMGFRRFMLRGVVQVRGEWDLVCAAFNLRRPRTRGRMRLRRAGENPPPVRGAE